MKTRILPHQILRITEGRHKELHRRLLGIDISDRHIEPIYRGVFYVDARNETGRELVLANTPAKCVYRTGEIYCLYDERIPLTEARLVHEFLHRAARRRIFFAWTSGIDTRHKRTLANEVITEYLTRCILGELYEQQADARNRYRPYLSEIEAVEEKAGRKRLVKAYLEGNALFFARYKKLMPDLW